MVDALAAMLANADFWAAVLRIATPLVLGTLGVLLCERAGVLNLGIEGIMVAGAFTGWLALSSRAFYGFQLRPALSLRATLVGAVVLLDGVFLASIRPWLATTIPDAGPALRAE